MFRASKSFEALQSPEVSVAKSQGVVGGDGDEVGRCRLEEDAEAESRRNEGWGSGKVRGGREKSGVRRGCFYPPHGQLS